jgi:hypothetical protein
MTMEPIDLNAVRKEIEESEREVQALRSEIIACLQYAIDKIKNNEWNPRLIYVAAEGEEAGKSVLYFTATNMNSYEIKGLLAQHLHMQCDPDHYYSHVVVE